MTTADLHRIGAFAARSGFSIKALRFYDEIGLLSPAAVSEGSRYRLYNAVQLERARQIRALKELGLSLPEIARLLDGAVSEQVTLEAAEARLIGALADRGRELAAVRARLARLRAQGPLGTPYVRLRQQPARRIASVRDVLSAAADAAELRRELAASVGRWVNRRVGRSPWGALWHGCGHRGEKLEAEAFVAVRAEARPGGRVRVWELPAAATACAETADEDAAAEVGYDALRVWLGAHGRVLGGPKRELYRDGTPDEPGAQRLEIHFPLAASPDRLSAR